MLFQPSNITPDEVNGSGYADLTQDLNISWRVNGNSAMTGYQITIYDNNTASTQKYTTGRVELAEPFWGVNYAGTQQYYTATIPASILATSGITNGNTYKLSIKQWWSATDFIDQITASVFAGRAKPTVTIADVPSPMAQSSYSFKATYTQAQNEVLKWVRWQIATEDDNGIVQVPFYDTGYIYGTGELQCDYDGFFTGNYYNVRISIQTESGQIVTTAWTRFLCSFSLPVITGTAVASLTGQGYVFVEWTSVASASTYILYRRDIAEKTITKLASVPANVGQLRDYAAVSNHTYQYYIWPANASGYVAEPFISEQIKVCRNYWMIFTAQRDSSGQLNATRLFLFRYGKGGVTLSNVSNNNSPTFYQNFTRYPNRQPNNSNYLSGSITGLIGSISVDKQYSDTITLADAIRELSTTTDEMYLLDPKGYFVKIHTSAPISVQTDVKAREMPQTATIPWVEVGSATDVHVFATPGGTLWPVDRVVDTQLTLDPITGSLMWTIPDDYSFGSYLSLSESGMLIQTADETQFTPAQMRIERTTGEVWATV